jgi:hypothetical protein
MASVTSFLLICELVFHPTILRANTSTTNAVNTHPDLVRQYVKSATHKRFGATALNWRLTRSGARCADGSAMVVRGLFFFNAPRHPISRITRSTVHRDTSIPSLRNIIQVFREPRTRINGCAHRRV